MDGAAPQAGWYPDPNGSGRQRWWDGATWADLQPVVATVPGQPLNTWLWQSIVVTLLCCLPFGIVGIVQASGASTALKVGNYDLAVQKAGLARTWSLIGVGCGLALWLPWALVVGGIGALV